jgi:hypothetical protein
MRLWLSRGQERALRTDGRIHGAEYRVQAGVLMVTRDAALRRSLRRRATSTRAARAHSRCGRKGESSARGARADPPFAAAVITATHHSHGARLAVFNGVIPVAPLAI